VTVVWNRESRTPGTRKSKITWVVGSEGRLLAVDSVGEMFQSSGVGKTRSLASGFMKS
jgi:hypothetical protein